MPAVIGILSVPKFARRELLWEWLAEREGFKSAVQLCQDHRSAGRSAGVHCPDEVPATLKIARGAL
jgi:hypothetical protein